MRRFREKKLAERWDVSPRTLQQWRWQGRGPRFMKIGGAVIYRLDDVEAYERENLHQNTSGPLPSDVAGTAAVTMPATANPVSDKAAKG